jgi:hypothetical protein
MARRKKIALIAHDNKKNELLEWAKLNWKLWADPSLYSTSTTGQLLKLKVGLKVTLLECGPLGGDQQIGSRISEGQIDFVQSSSVRANRFIAMDIVDPAIDFHALAASMGVPARRVDRASDIAPAIEAGIASGAPNLVEIAVGAT